MNKFLPAVFLFLLSGMFSGLDAQERITADRPDQTESAVLTPRHYFQAEFGFSKENSGNRNYDILHPGVLLKYGLATKFELRLETNWKSSYEHLIPQTRKSTGFEPVRIGFRTALWEEKKIIPRTSVLVHFGIPGIASKNFKAIHIAPSILLAMENDLSAHAGIGYNIGLEWDGFTNKPVWIYSATGGVDLGKKFDLFLEFFGFAKQNELANNNIDGGLGFYASDNVKLDAYVGAGITENSLTNFFGVGVSFRFH